MLVAVERILRAFRVQTVFPSSLGALAVHRRERERARGVKWLSESVKSQRSKSEDDKQRVRLAKAQGIRGIQVAN